MDWNRAVVAPSNLVTLVTDLRGSTPVLTSADHEAVKIFIRSFSAIVLRTVRHIRADEHNINSFGGDGFVHFFFDRDQDSKTPLIAQLAVNAALDMRTLLRDLRGHPDLAGEGFENLDFVAAISFGEVLYGLHTGPAYNHSTGLIRPVITAFRLASEADPGQILISESVYDAVVGTANYIIRELPTLIDLKGLGPSRVFEIQDYASMLTV